MGGSAPWVKIMSPAPGAHFVRGTETVELRANTDDYEEGRDLPIHWTSSLDGNLATTDSGAIRNLGASGLSLGDHHICAAVEDDTSRSWQDCRDVSVTSSPPDVDILLPIYGSDFYESDTIHLNANIYDADGPDPIEVEWRVGYRSSSWEDLTPVAYTANASIPASQFGHGHYQAIVHATDASGAAGGDFTTFSIWEDPSNLPPSVTIEEPTQGATIQSEGGAVTIQLVASAHDLEDGPIPFDQISWWVTVEGGVETELPVTTNTRCVIGLPGYPCQQYETTHTIELAPVGSQTSTRYDIKGRVSDSEGTPNGVNDGRVTVYITQLI
jgi:hypothetical protein